MKILNLITPINFLQKNQRDVLRYKYLNPDKTVQAVLTVDKKTHEFISYDTFTKENPYIEPKTSLDPKIAKSQKKHHQPGDVFTTKYLKKDKKTVDMEVKYRWINDNDFEVVEVIHHD